MVKRPRPPKPQPLKHDDRPYRSGRTGDWLKIKCIQSDSFLVVGYEPSTAVRGAIARLLLAAREDDGLVYVSSVGTDFKHAEARSLKKLLDGMRTDRPAVAKGQEPCVHAAGARGRDRIPRLDR